MISRPFLSLRKVFTYVLLFTALAPLLFISHFLTNSIGQTLLDQKEQQVQNAVSTIAQEIVTEFDRIQQSLNWLSRDRFNIQALENILYSSVVTHNLTRFSELSNLINSVYILNDDWEPLYDLYGRPYHFENSQLLKEISKDKSIYEKGLTEARFYTEPNLIKGMSSSRGVALVTPMLAYNLEGAGRYRASGYVVVLISFDTIEKHFQHFLLQDESFNVNQHIGSSLIRSSVTDRDDIITDNNDALDRLFILNNPFFSSPLKLDISYQFSDIARLKEMKSTLVALFSVIGWTFITVLFIAMGISRWLSRELFEMQDTIVAYALNKSPKEKKYQFTEFDRMAVVLNKMSITIQSQLFELKSKNTELNASKGLIELNNEKLSNFNQELEIQVKKQTSLIRDALFREELNKNNLAAVIEFGTEYKSLDFHEVPHTVELQLSQLFPHTEWALRFAPLGEHLGIQINSSEDKLLASLRFVSTPELEEQVLVFELFVKQLSSWLELADIARTDSLLSCGNRKAFNEDLLSFQKRFRDSEVNWNFGLFIFDVNGLKAINDKHGHYLGDELIRVTGNNISNLLLNNMKFYRIGGDEFALLAKNTTTKECELFFEQLQKNQQNLKYLDNRGEAYLAHYSIGWSCSDSTELIDMFRVSDELMYQYKRAYYLKK